MMNSHAVELAVCVESSSSDCGCFHHIHVITGQRTKRYHPSGEYPGPWGGRRSQQTKLVWVVLGFQWSHQSLQDRLWGQSYWRSV